mmetsp:Transcript_11938/g.13150  ORF Transcript_11938/g.13150 Transcript_11938/m.13150 type:complete len:651 (-) Transcript_11938:31-1983(-)
MHRQCERSRSLPLNKRKLLTHGPLDITEVLLMVFAHILPKDRKSCQAVCSRWYCVCKDYSINWVTLTNLHFSDNKTAYLKASNKHVYRSCNTRPCNANRAENTEINDARSWFLKKNPNPPVGIDVQGTRIVLVDEYSNAVRFLSNLFMRHKDSDEPILSDINYTVRIVVRNAKANPRLFRLRLLKQEGDVERYQVKVQINFVTLETILLSSLSSDKESLRSLNAFLCHIYAQPKTKFSCSVDSQNIKTIQPLPGAPRYTVFYDHYARCLISRRAVELRHKLARALATAKWQFCANGSIDVDKVTVFYDDNDCEAKKLTLCAKKLHSVKKSGVLKNPHIVAKEITESDQNKPIMLDKIQSMPSRARENFAPSFHPSEYGILDEVHSLLAPDATRINARKMFLTVRGQQNEHTDISTASCPQDLYGDLEAIGTLVVCLPSDFEGGLLTLRHAGNTKTLDWSVRSASEMQWAAFSKDATINVSPVTRGHQITITYSLYKSQKSGSSSDRGKTDINPLYTPLSVALKDKHFLPQGGKIGFVCQHMYKNTPVYGSKSNPVKGADAALFAAAKALSMKVKVVPLTHEYREVLHGTPQLALDPLYRESASNAFLDFTVNAQDVCWCQDLSDVKRRGAGIVIDVAAFEERVENVLLCQ